MGSLLSCVLDVVYHVLVDAWHCIAWVRKKLKANRTLGFIFVPVAVSVCGTAMELFSQAAWCLPVCAQKKSPQPQEWTRVSQKTMCLKAGDEVKRPLALSLKGVKENSTVAKLEQWPRDGLVLRSGALDYLFLFPTQKCCNARYSLCLELCIILLQKTLQPVTVYSSSVLVLSLTCTSVLMSRVVSCGLYRQGHLTLQLCLYLVCAQFQGL